MRVVWAIDEREETAGITDPKDLEEEKRRSSSLNSVVIMGAGGIGFWLSVSLMRDLNRDIAISVFDDDNFLGGMGAKRLPLVRNTETLKVDFLKGFVRMVMGDRSPAVFGVRFETDIATTGHPAYTDLHRTIIVDCTDMALEPRRAIWDVTRARGAKMLRVSYDGNGVVVVAGGLPLVDRAGGGYALVPSLAQSFAAAGLGAMAIERLLDGKDVDEFQVQI